MQIATLSDVLITHLEVLKHRFGAVQRRRIQLKHFVHKEVGTRKHKNQREWRTNQCTYVLKH